ncbi:unnamed protein product, partial [Sphacelaria rigidula]
ARLASLIAEELGYAAQSNAKRPCRLNLRVNRNHPRPRASGEERKALGKAGKLCAEQQPHQSTHNHTSTPVSHPKEISTT